MGASGRKGSGDFVTSVIITKDPTGEEQDHDHRTRTITILKLLQKRNYDGVLLFTKRWRS